MEIWILIGILLAGGAAVIGLYNALVRKSQMVEEGWSGIDVQLRRRANLVPNLVKTVTAYHIHEAETLATV